jgi:hypothetical protein
MAKRWLRFRHLPHTQFYTLQLSSYPAFSVSTQLMMVMVRAVESRDGMPLVTRMFASSEHAWDPMASSSVNFCRRTRTMPARYITSRCIMVVHSVGMDDHRRCSAATVWIFQEAASWCLLLCFAAPAKIGPLSGRGGLRCSMRAWVTKNKGVVVALVLMIHLIVAIHPAPATTFSSFSGV